MLALETGLSCLQALSSWVRWIWRGCCLLRASHPLQRSWQGGRRGENGGHCRPPPLLTRRLLRKLPWLLLELHHLWLSCW